MTVSATTRVVRHFGDGTATSFPYSFRIDTAADAKVVLEEIATGERTALTSSQYAISGLGDDEGGTVVYPLSGSALSADFAIIVYREVPHTQTLQISNQGGFFPAVYEAALDRVVHQIQQVGEEQGRSLRVPIGDAVSDLELPAAAVRASKVLAFGASGQVALGQQTIITDSAIYATQADLEGAVIDEGVQWVILVGLTAVGDGNFAVYKHVMTEPASDGIQSADGAWWERTLLDADLLGASANGLSLIQAANYAAMRALLDLEIGTDIQAQNANLASLAGLPLAANKGLYATDASTLALFNQTAFGRTWAGLADEAAARAALGVTSVGTRVAWANFDGSLITPTMRGSAGFNTTIADLGTGNYRLTFSSAQADTNYAVFISSGNIGASYGYSNVGAKTTTYVEIRTYGSGGGAADHDNVSVEVVR